MERHQQYHNDMNGLLRLEGSDLSELDFKRKDAALARGWAARNRLIAPMMPTQHHVDGFSSETDSADDAVGEDDIRW